jgi:hypothetical protein
MKRFLIVIAATAVAAAVTIPAVADSGSGSGSGSDPDETTFVNCLRTNGMDIPADTRGFAIKQWIAAHDSQPSVTDALKKCAPNDRIRGGDGPAELIACLKAKGLNPPTAAEQLKPWLTSQDPAVLKACGVDMRKADDHGGADIADCLRKNGANVPAGLEGIDLKNWIRDHESDPAVADALKKCQMDKPDCGGGETKPAAPPKPDATAKPDATPDPVTLQQ